VREKKESLRQPKEEEGIGGGGRTQFEALYISPKRGNFHIPLMGYKFQLLRQPVCTALELQEA
jgi:hypothetical protein